MRIVIDLQGAQSSGSRHRGIGRYSVALTEALLQQAASHEILLVANGAFSDTIDSLRERFASISKPENFRVWESPHGTAAIGPNASAWRRGASELLREAFISSLKPDVVVVTSLFEGLMDDAVTSVGAFAVTMPTAVILYDLIPLINRKPYLENPEVEAWYEGKLASARRADLLLAISNSSREEAIRYLGASSRECLSISTAADPCFRPTRVPERDRRELFLRHHINRPFVMYTGGIDHRKNIEGLVRAYARLAPEVRVRHQLAVVCSIQPQDRARLAQLGQESGLATDEVVFTGFVSDADLLALYNLCKLFVFPSWHEGFGLPALEAMACGRAVIAANTSSLPEVVGREDALFDPFSDDDMAVCMCKALTNDSWRHELERHSLEQSKLFSWKGIGGKVLLALEQLHASRMQAAANRPAMSLSAGGSRLRPKLAVVCPLLPERSGISHYNAELLPELARFYDIELISTLAETSDTWAKGHGPMRSPDWLIEHAGEYARVLYHFGNSEFHRHMFDLIAKVPGIVVLHDFYFGHVAEYMHAKGDRAGGRAVTLHRNHGYGAAQQAFSPTTAERATWDFPCNLDVLRHAQGVIVHSQDSRSLARRWHGAHAADNWAVIPLLRAPLNLVSKAQARAALGIDPAAFVVCSFGLLGSTKLNDRLLGAWKESALSSDPTCHLFFVGENDNSPYGKDLERAVGALPGPGRARITGWVDDERYRLFLAAADVAAQLRNRSRGETSAAALDCLNAGIATIVNGHGSLAELPRDGVWMLPDLFETPELTLALESLWQDATARVRMTQRGRAEITERHSPRECAGHYAQAIEAFQSHRRPDSRDLASAIARLDDPTPRAAEWMALARAAAWSLPMEPLQRQLLVDVSVLARVDAGTGIQRVVRSILLQWLTPGNGNGQTRVEPVYAADDGSYRYARRFVFRFLGGPDPGLDDPEVEAHLGDQYIALDLNPNWQPGHLAFHQRLRRLGIPVRFVVYDLLPVQMPQHFPEQAAATHHHWLTAVAAGDGAICISRAVADELFDWLQRYGSQNHRPFRIDWFHLGSDLQSSKSSPGMAEVDLRKLAQWGDRALLMVGTVEPRKRHGLVLDAFELLWREGSNLKLIVIGKAGWNISTLIHRMRAHPEAGRRLIWIEQASDELLQQAYYRCQGMIAASDGEGFGLNLVEAARAGLPILARDIPVFREVAGLHASYFAEAEADSLAGEIRAWVRSITLGTAPSSRGMPLLTWQESAVTLRRCLDSLTAYRLWEFDGVYRFMGNDFRFKSEVGVRQALAVQSTARAGYLVYGPFIRLPAGSYRFVLMGSAVPAGLTGAHVDAAIQGGTQVLASYGAEKWLNHDGQLLIGHLDLERDCVDFELRVWVPSTAQVTIDGLELSRSSQLAKVSAKLENA